MNFSNELVSQKNFILVFFVFGMAKATFAMGCFWQPDVLFAKLPGVVKTTVGYIGGDEKKFPRPTYEQVCTGRTGYAEAIQIEFDEKKVSYEELLKIFWSNHNPTTLNQQGPDVGEQYRSAVFYHDAKQRALAEKMKAVAQKKWNKPIVTEIIKAATFFPAEDYHQKYLQKRGLESCHI